MRRRRPERVALGRATRAEIVDVDAVIADPAAPAGAASCLREATWALEPPAAFDFEHGAFSVSL